jgi:ankyrin repeat protein
MNIPETSQREFSDAMESGNIEVVLSMLGQYPTMVHLRSWTPPPLHCAILWNQREVAQILLEAGADLELCDPDRQTTPLRYAVMYCKLELIPLLISRGANFGVIEKGGMTALQLAEAAAAGEYEEFDDLPRREEYLAVVALLRDLLD